MSKYFWLSKVNNHKHMTAPRSGLKSKVRISRSMLSVLFFAAIILLGATYLVQVNRTATSGFAVNDLNRKISELKENNQKLELEIADLQSLQNIQESSERLKLVAHTKLEYIQPSEGVVALEQ